MLDPKVIKAPELSPRQRELMAECIELRNDMEMNPYEMSSVGVWFVGNAIMSMPEEQRADFKKRCLEGLDAMIKTATMNEAN